MIRLLFVFLMFLFIAPSCSSRDEEVVKAESSPQIAVSTEKSANAALLPDDEPENAVAEQAKSKSVLDYYLLLPPDNYFYQTPDNAKARRSYIKIEDVKNGYLKIEKPYVLEDVSKLPEDDRELANAENETAKARALMEIALFKQKQGRNIIVVNYAVGVDNPFEVVFKLDFWEDDNGVLKDVTERYRAKIDKNMAFAEFRSRLQPTDKDLRFESADDIAFSLHPELPRYGKTIKIIVNPDLTKRRFELLHLVWNGEEFVCKPASKK